MSALEERIRLALAAEADLWDELPQDGLVTVPSRSRVPGWLAAAATAAAVLVAVAGAVWMVERSSDDETTGSAQPISALPPIEIGTFSQVAGSDGEFGVEPLSEEPDRNGDILATTTISSVAESKQGIVAVGTLDGSDGGIGAVWHSADGTQWQRVPHDDAVFGVPGEVPNTMVVDVAGGDAGYVAVGVRFTQPREHIVWQSQDGLTWSRNEVPGLDTSAVISTDAGWTAVGGGGLQGAVWNSSDGLAWDVASSNTFASDTHDISITDVAHDGVRFVAVGGSSSRTVREERPVIWTSSDGVVWQRVEDKAGVFDIPAAGGVDHVVAGPAGFVALGEERVAEGDDPAYVVVWTSADGADWERVRVGDADSGIPVDLTASAAGYVIVGVHSDDDVVYNTRLWTSTDGVEWDTTDAGELPDHAPTAALASERRLLLFGSLRRAGADTYDNLGLGAGAVWEAAL